MKSVYIFLVVFTSCIYISYCKDLIVGTSFNNRLVWRYKAEYESKFLKRRATEITYSDPDQQIIKGVIARDLDNSDAEATITAGGVGQSYVNIKLHSKRGYGLNYQIEIYM